MYSTAQYPQSIAVPSNSGVNIQIYNPSLVTPGSQGPVYNVNSPYYGMGTGTAALNPAAMNAYAYAGVAGSGVDPNSAVSSGYAYPSNYYTNQYGTQYAAAPAVQYGMTNPQQPAQTVATTQPVLADTQTAAQTSAATVPADAQTAVQPAQYGTNPVQTAISPAQAQNIGRPVIGYDAYGSPVFGLQNGANSGRQIIGQDMYGNPIYSLQNGVNGSNDGQSGVNSAANANGALNLNTNGNNTLTVLAVLFKKAAVVVSKALAGIAFRHRVVQQVTFLHGYVRF